MNSSTPDPRILRALEAATNKLEAMERRQTEPVAIVAMACRFPGADTPEAFWDLLVNGRDAVGPLPPARVAQERPSQSRDGGYLDNVDQFDAAFFGISPREAMSLDPQQRILLETTMEAFEAAGWTRAGLRGTRAAVFVGVTSTDYGRMLARSSKILDNYYVTGNTLNATAGRLAYVFGLRGPALAVDTACSSSLTALHLACQHLRSRESDVALSAGVNLVITDDGTRSLDDAGVLSSDGRCRTFDAAASGMGRGEGCGVLLLKRLTDARRDNDDIIALVRGSAVNQDGASAGLTVPNGQAQEEVIRQALATARVSPLDVDYIEAHGTGTPLGDPIELDALARVFSDNRSSRQRLLVGAVKANIAHGESSAGIAGVIKTALSLRHGAIPPLANFATPSPHVDWTTPIEVPRTVVPWPRSARLRIAGVSGFGFSGTNAHVVLAEAPAPASDPAQTTDTDGEPSGPVVLPFSAQTAEATGALITRYEQFLADSDTSFSQIAQAAAIRRDHYSHRVAVVAESAREAADALSRTSTGALSPDLLKGVVTSGTPLPVAFVFAGQGEQAVGMGEELRRAYPVFARAVDACTARFGRDPFDVIDSIEDTALAQPALFCYEYALAQLWQSLGVTPGAVLGHSVGEFAAACIAGVLTLDDALRLVTERGRLMAALPQIGAMTAVLASRDVVAETISPFASEVSVAAVNGPENTVISGARGTLETISATLTARAIRCVPLAVSHAFHSPLIAPAVGTFREVLKTAQFNPPRLPFYSTTRGRRVSQELTTAEYWIDHALQPVDFMGAVRTAHTDGVRRFLEIGPHHTLTGFGRVSIDDTETSWIPSQRRPLDGPRQLQRALAELYTSGAAVDWSARGTITRVALPGYPFQREHYWSDGAFDGCAADDEAGNGILRVAWRARDHSRDATGRTERWSILRDDDGLAARVAGELRARGHTAEVITKVDDMAANTAIVHIASKQASDTVDWESAREAGFAQALEVLQTNIRSGTRTWFVTRGAQQVDSETSVSQQAALWGLGRSAALEQPGAWGGLIDLDPGSPDSSALVDALLGGSAEVAIRHGVLLSPELVPASAPENAAPPFSPRRSFVVTGAFGALGRHTVDWLLARGARKIVLCSRQPPSVVPPVLKASAEAVDATLVVRPVNLEHEDEVRRALATAEELGPLGGIIHAAGVIDDATLPSQALAQFDTVTAGKVRGAWHLDRLTQGRPLDFFILYSSLSAVLGSPGQANYAAANAMLDAIAAARVARGDQALSIAWGAWSGEGMAAEREAALRTRGLDAWSPTEAMARLDALVLRSRGCVSVARLNPDAIRAAFPAAALPMLNAISPQDPVAQVATPMPVVRSADEAASYLEGAIAAVLRLEGERTISRSTSLLEQGLDSMMATELRNRVLRELGVDLPITRFLGEATVPEVARALAREVSLSRVSHANHSSESEEVIL